MASSMASSTESIRKPQGLPWLFFFSSRRWGSSQFIRALARSCHCRYNRNLKTPAQFLRIDLDASRLGFIYHVQSDNRRYPQFKKLNGEVQIPLQVGGVDDVDDHRRAVGNKEFAGHSLVKGVGSERVDAGEIYQAEFMSVALICPNLLFHRHAGIIAHVVVGPGDRIEKGRLSAIGIACQGNERFLPHQSSTSSTVM